MEWGDEWFGRVAAPQAGDEFAAVGAEVEAVGAVSGCQIEVV